MLDHASSVHVLVPHVVPRMPPTLVIGYVARALVTEFMAPSKAVSALLVLQAMEETVEVCQVPQKPNSAHVVPFLRSHLSHGTLRHQQLFLPCLFLNPLNLQEQNSAHIAQQFVDTSVPLIMCETLLPTLPTRVVVLWNYLLMTAARLTGCTPMMRGRN